MAAWYYQGDGLKLWEEAYAAFNLVPRPARRWPADGWMVRKKINTIGDFKGLKMRIPSLGGKVYRQGGRHDGPHPGRRDLRRARAGRDRRRRMGRAARRHEARPPQDRAVLLLSRLARARHHERVRLQQEGLRGAPGGSAADARPCRGGGQVYGLTDYHAKNAIALERLKTEFKGKVEILQFPAPVLRDLKKLAAEVVKEESEKSPMARKVHASFTKFQAQLAGWSRLGRRLPPVRGAVIEEPPPYEDHGTTPVHRQGRRGAGGRGAARRRRRPERHRPAEGPVADVHGLDRRRSTCSRARPSGWRRSSTR